MAARFGLLIVPVLACVLFPGCSGQSDVRSAKDGAASGTIVKGAGSTFAAPLYKKWSEEYRSVKPDVQIEYAAVGSGEGQERFLQGTVDFGASDAVLAPEQLARVERGAVTIPIAVGGIVMAYNSEGLPNGLKLPRDVYVDIFLGKIVSWNDSRIAAANPEITLPKLSIHPIVRQDGSGTTYAFTSHLSAVSSEWRGGPGAGKLIAWPHKYPTVAGNDPLAGMVKRVHGGVAYIEFGTARAAGLHMAQLQNKQGRFIAPSSESIQAAVSSGGAGADRLTALQDPDANGAYPIVTCTWLLAHKKPAAAKHSAAVREFAEWCVTKGQDACEPLGYVRLPPDLAATARQTADEIGR